ncbi:MAG: TRAP transporter small permease subunit [Syntrophobacterales bacterium]|nr:TRAP transporter small permease subunit [Syntrophobacterales bacterium]
MQKFIQFINRLSTGLGLLIAPLTGIIALLVLYEVFCRYFINAATSWTAEMEGYLQSALVMLGGAYVLNKEGHVRVDVISRRFNRRKQAGIDILTVAAVFLATGPMIWFGGGLAWEALITGQASASAAEIVLWPSLAAVPIGAGVLLLQALANGAASFLYLRKTKKAGN